MPELPEVETVRRVLEKWLIGRKIKEVIFFYNKVLVDIEEQQFINTINNQTINKINRRGKFLLFELDEHILISHLRMEGKYFLVEDYTIDPYLNKHKIVAFYLDDGNKLVYHDVRKFGKMQLVLKGKLNENKSMLNLGEEPFTITSEKLFKSLNKSNRKIKTLLLDQSIMSGLGNIYVDEVLFRSKINPSTPGNKLNKKQVKTILENSIVVLNKAIQLGGSSVYSYSYGNEISGRFQNVLQVYGKEKEACPICGETILKTKIGGRGTHYCPQCQK